MTTHFFADESNSFVSSDNVHDMFAKCNKVMSDIFEWCCANKLTVNLEKTSFIIFKPNQQFLKVYTDQKYKISINGIDIQRTNSIKFLGMLLDEQLSFKEHVQEIILALKRVIGITYRKRNLLPFQCRKIVFFHWSSLKFVTVLRSAAIFINVYYTHL